MFYSDISPPFIYCNETDQPNDQPILFKIFLNPLKSIFGLFFDCLKNNWILRGTRPILKYDTDPYDRKIQIFFGFESHANVREHINLDKAG